MKNIFAVLLLASSIAVTAQEAFFSQANVFFKENVSREGLVNYERARQNPRLNILMQMIAEADLESMDEATRKAFLINTYNIAVIKEVVDLLPLKSPLDKSDFFNGIRHNVGGQQMTLDDIEKGTLYKEFPDPRLHFVLVCAAKSCPPLAQFAYRPDGLEEQLEERTKYVLNLDWFVQVNNGKVQLSQIFEWYRGDFEQNDQKLLGYVNQYRYKKLEAKRPTFYKYDWSLNAQR